MWLIIVERKWHSRYSIIWTDITSDYVGVEDTSQTVYPLRNITQCTK